MTVLEMYFSNARAQRVVNWNVENYFLLNLMTTRMLSRRGSCLSQSKKKAHQKMRLFLFVHYTTRTYFCYRSSGHTSDIS